MSISGAISVAVSRQVENVKNQIDSRMMRGANALRNAELQVLAGPSPSAPGSTPGVRSGNLRRNWTMQVTGGGGSGTFGITSGMNYAGYLEGGTRKMAARPFVDKVQQEALPQIKAIFEEIGGG